MSQDATLTFAKTETGTPPQTGGTAIFKELERFELGSGDDTVDASDATGGITVIAGAGDGSLTDGAGGDTLTGAAGLQPLRWAKLTTITPAQMLAEPALRRIRIARGALGPYTPHRTTMVSLQHRMLVVNKAL